MQYRVSPSLRRAVLSSAVASYDSDLLGGAHDVNTIDCAIRGDFGGGNSND